MPNMFFWKIVFHINGLEYFSLSPARFGRVLVLPEYIIFKQCFGFVTPVSLGNGSRQREYYFYTFG